jgi:hypothetical protein
LWGSGLSRDLSDLAIKVLAEKNEPLVNTNDSFIWKPMAQVPFYIQCLDLECTVFK